LGFALLRHAGTQSQYSSAIYYNSVSGEYSLGLEPLNGDFGRIDLEVETLKRPKAPETQEYVLALDIERAGGTESYPTIAIGATVLNTKGELLDQFFHSCYVPGSTTFQVTCWERFWKKNLDVLKILDKNAKELFATYAREHANIGICSLEKMELILKKEMIQRFVKFVAKWEQIAKTDGIPLFKVTDCPSYDVYFLNHDISRQNMIDIEPFPNDFSTGEYGKVVDVGSMQRMLLIREDPSWSTRTDGFAAGIRDMFDVTPLDGVSHDHLPHHDAHVIAHDYLTLINVTRGSVYKKKGYKKLRD